MLQIKKEEEYNKTSYVLDKIATCLDQVVLRFEQGGSGGDGLGDKWFGASRFYGGRLAVLGG